ncbi:MAG: hypothetical protein ACK2UB_14945, partial [Anaerolineales bacterium]
MNKATRTFTMVFGIIFGVSGISHGLFEALQGNVPTEGIFISAVGEAQRMWPHGAEPALTLIPNFLAAGIVTIIVGAALIVWSIAGVHKTKGSTVFLILFLVLLFVGGGVAQVLFFPVFWLVSTRINSPLSWWERAIPRAARGALSRVWAVALALAAGLMSAALFIAFTGYVPLIDDPETVLSV